MLALAAWPLTSSIRFVPISIELKGQVTVRFYFSLSFPPFSRFVFFLFVLSFLLLVLTEYFASRAASAFTAPVVVVVVSVFFFSWILSSDLLVSVYDF
jgi:hypothetical protein